MRYPQVLKFVGKLIYERGLNYYNREMIDEFSIHDRSIQAVVKGSLSNRYAVEIHLDEHDSVVRAECNCPYWSRCKHIAAVLIRYFHDKNEPLEHKTDHLFPGEQKKREKIFQITYDLPPSREIRRLCRDVEEYSHYQQYDDGKLWNIVFKLKKEIVLVGEEFRFFLSPALQYIKKDGTPGTIYNYSPRKNFQCSHEENEILQSLLCYEENKAPFFPYLHHFIDNPELRLYYFHQYKSTLVRCFEIKKTILTFDLVEIRTEDSYFSPILTFYNEDTKQSSTKMYKHFPVKGGTLFGVFSENGELFYCKQKPEYGFIIENLLSMDHIFTPSDILYLKKEINTLLPETMSVQFDAQSIKMIDMYPVPIINIKSLFQGRIEMHISLDYSGNEIGVKDEDGFIIHEQNGTTITIIKKKSSVEREIIGSIFSYFQSRIGDGLRMKGASVYQMECTLLTFLSDLAPALIEKGYHLRIGKEKTIQRNKGSFQFNLSSNIDWFNLDIYYVDDNGNKVQTDLSLEDIRQGIGKVGDSYILLNKEDCEKLKKILSACRRDKKELRFSKLNFDIIDSLYQDAATIHNEEIDNIYAIFLKLRNITMIPSHPLPVGFNATLRNYQKAGYDWLLFLKEIHLNGCLADDMGLGKTVQTLALLEKLKEDNNLSLSLLVLPVTTFANWESEIERFAPSLRFIRHAGRKRADSMDIYKDYDIILVSYHTLRNDITMFSSCEYDYLILDESQSIKNAFSKTFKAIRIIKARHKLSLTGTPVENNTLELWAQMDFLNPGILGSFHEFKKRFTRPIEEYGDKQASETLKKIVYPFILRRKKEEVLADLPEKEIIYKYVEMNSAQKEAYSQVSMYYREKVKATIEKKGLKRSSIEIIEALLRLRQMVLFPFLVSPQYAHISSSKFELLKEMLDEILEEHHKVLIFSQFVQVLKQIEEFLKERTIPYSYIDGSTKKRSGEIKQFQENKGIPVFLLSLKAGGLGINLTAADYIILFDPWWNPAIEKQAIDRSHRIGQTQKVIAFKIIVKDSIEEKIIDLQNRKENLVNNIVVSEKNVFKAFDENEILHFFDSDQVIE